MHRIISLLKHVVAIAVMISVGVPATSAWDAVENASSPKHGTRHLVFEEEWRLRDDAPEYLIGVPVAAVAAEQRVFLLDQQLGTIWAFNDQGRFLHRFGSFGEGPGDFRSPCALVDFGNGTIGSLDRSPAQLHTHDPLGNLLRTHRIEGDALRTAGYSIKGSDSLFVLLRSEVDPIKEAGKRGTISWTSLVRLTPDGQCGVVYHEKMREFVYYGRTRPVREEEQYVVSGYDVHQNRLYAAVDRDRYAVTVLAATGDTLQVITRSYESRRRSAAERDSISARRSQSVGGCVIVEYRAAEYDQAILDLHVARDGRLWVLSSRGAHDPPRGTYQVWDVFDEHGLFIEQVELILDASRTGDRVFWLEDDRVLLCRNWADAEATFNDTPPGNGTAAEQVSLPVDTGLQIICMTGRMEGGRAAID